MKLLNKLLIASAVSGLIATTGMANDLVKLGEKVYTNKKLGNCVACHALTGNKKVTDMSPGSFGPDLAMYTGANDKDSQKALYNVIFDIYKDRGMADSAMPAFGTSGHLSNKEIEAVVAYITK